MKQPKQMIVIGAGAAGIFAAITCKEAFPSLQVTVLEKTEQLLTKVRVSGGGRCNVTHNAFDPKKLTSFYPRGSKELLGAFYRFQPQDTVRWFQEHGVTLKTEPDGRMFPTSNSSETIVECLLGTARKLGVVIQTGSRIFSVTKEPSGYQIQCEKKEPIFCDILVLATGGSSQGHMLASSLGHTITEIAPSLFTFNVPTSPLHDLSGITLADVELSLPEFSLKQRGPLLLTHFGFSGPAALKLSAWGARELKRCQYKTTLNIHWAPQFSQEQLYAQLLLSKEQKPFKTFASENPCQLPMQLWKTLLKQNKIAVDAPLSHLSNASLQTLARALTCDPYRIEGKTTNKEEFVTCGGVSLKEIDCKTFESKLHPGLFFVGEILDVDGVTGGFNFQNAWTSAYLVHTSSRLKENERAL